MAKMISLKNTTITIEAKTNSLEIGIDEGQLSFTEAKSYIHKLNNGRLAGKIDDDEMPLEVSFTLIWGELVSYEHTPDAVPVTVISPRDILYGLSKEGVVTFETVGDPCNAYCTNLVITPDGDCALDEKITLKELRVTSMNYDAKAKSITVSAQCGVSKAEFAAI